MLKSLKKATGKARLSIWTALNKVQFRLRGIVYGKNLRTNGWVYARNRGKITIGNNVKINSGFKFNPIGSSSVFSMVVSKGALLEIGDDVGLSNSHIYAAKRIRIGDRSIVGGDVKIFDTDFHPLDAHERYYSKNDPGKAQMVDISNDVFVGTSAIILKGSIIQEGVVIGAGSVVSMKTLEENSVYSGNPVKWKRRLT